MPAQRLNFELGSVGYGEATVYRQSNLVMRLAEIDCSRAIIDSVGTMLGILVIDL